jgi:hypothetical protein
LVLFLDRFLHFYPGKFQSFYLYLRLQAWATMLDLFLKRVLLAFCYSQPQSSIFLSLPPEKLWLQACTTTLSWFVFFTLIQAALEAGHRMMQENKQWKLCKMGKALTRQRRAIRQRQEEPSPVLPRWSINSTQMVEGP